MFQRHSLMPRLAMHLLLSAVMVAGSLPLIAQAQEFIPPDRGVPGRREGGGTRGNCIRNGASLIALIPATNFGTTLEAYPTFFWYVPQSSHRAAEFVLLDANDREIYTTTFQIGNRSGIISIALPADGSIPPLEAGKDYHWYFSLICDPRDRSGDTFAEGWIQRVVPSPGLTSQLTAALEGDRPAIYAQAGIWHDALTLLASLRQSNPTNPQFMDQWATLLTSVGLENIIDQPLINCCNAPASQTGSTIQHSTAR